MEEVLERYARKEGIPLAVAQEHGLELKRYLALCAMNPQASYGMRGPIDELWHTFLLFTEKYASFCDQIGGNFLHHAPNTSDRSRANGQDGRRIGEGYVRFLEDYKAAYGESAPPHLWPRPMKHEIENLEVGCGCGYCYCGGGGCSCVIAIA
jgi:hypothetical protein